MKRPVVIINLKTYLSGKKSLNLIKKIGEVDSKIIIGCQPTEIYQASQLVKNPIYVEHVDSLEPGRNTGFILPEAVKASGASGVFLNHSEHRLDLSTIKKTVKRCKDLRLRVCLFAKDLSQARELKKLKPDYLVIEPPELIAGEKSVSRARPELIEEIGKRLKYPFIVGAGVKDGEDVRIAMKFGASGVALASAVTTAKNPEGVLRGLVG